MISWLLLALRTLAGMAGSLVIFGGRERLQMSRGDAGGLSMERFFPVV